MPRKPVVARRTLATRVKNLELERKLIARELRRIRELLEDGPDEAYEDLILDEDDE